MPPENQSSDSEPFVVRFQDDESFERGRDVIEGLTFVATFQVRTPLAVLQHHGEFHPGPPSAAPKYASLADGFWSYKTKSWAQLAGRAVSVPDVSEAVYASDIGPVSASYYLPFLKVFRAIVEAAIPPRQKLAKLKQLRSDPNEFREIWASLQNSYPDFPQSFFYLQLTAIPGVGRKMAKQLFECGFEDIESLRSAPDTELKRVPRLGAKLIQRIRLFGEGNDIDDETISPNSPTRDAVH